MLNYFEKGLTLKLTRSNSLKRIRKKRKSSAKLVVSNFQLPFSYYSSFFRSISNLEDSFYSIINDLDSKSDTVLVHMNTIDSLERNDSLCFLNEIGIARTNLNEKRGSNNLIFYCKRIHENVYLFYHGPEKEGYLPYSPIMGRVHYFLVYKVQTSFKYLYKTIDFN